MSFSGKTTLVRALVDAGAVYYSDEFAALDETGRVIPYARRLTFVAPTRAQTIYSVEQLGGVAGVEPLRVGTRDRDALPTRG